MPLCTIFTKCPAPCGPQCSQPSAAVDESPARSPRARAPRPPPGASDAKIGASRATTSGSPPTIWQ